MAKRKRRDTAAVHYMRSLENGSIFISTPNWEPLRLKTYRDQVISGFEEAIVGTRKCPEKQKDCTNCKILDCPEET